VVGLSSSSPSLSARSESSASSSSSDSLPSSSSSPSFFVFLGDGEALSSLLGDLTLFLVGDFYGDDGGLLRLSFTIS